MLLSLTLFEYYLNDSGCHLYDNPELSVDRTSPPLLANNFLNKLKCLSRLFYYVDNYI